MSEEKKILVGFLLTPAQNESFKTARGTANKTDYMRGLCEADCAKKGIRWPDDMEQHGGNRTRVCPVCGSNRLIDPYGEWMCEDCGWECTDQGYD